MKVISYEADSGSKTDLHFSKMNFAKINLIVGDSATGKSRLLNTFFNGGRMAVQKNEFYIGRWDYVFEHQNKGYRWTLHTGGGKDESSKVLKETLARLNTGGKEEVIVQRDLNSFKFAGKDLPKLAADQTSISLLQDDDLIKPVHSAFTSIIRRSFAGPELDLSSIFETVPQAFIKRIRKNANIDDLFSSGLNLNGKLFILSQYFKNVFEKICTEFQSVFPFISEVDIKSADYFGLEHTGIVPVFAMKEKHLKNTWIPLAQFSSGMKKVLLIMTDIFTMPKEGGVYLIDEYENSLGINAINFFPSVLLNADTESQFIITSHHPYIIGNVPIKNWIILHRQGRNVLVKQGSDVESRFSKSKQQAFIQLINDPFYTEGVE